MWPSWELWRYELEVFFQSGGWVLYIILLVCFALTSLILERLVFIFTIYRPMKRQAMQQLRSDSQWGQKLGVMCDLDLAVKDSFSMIKVLIALCPLIGLLGTVSGMIQVFDSVSINGLGNPRTMASGVASATFPTLTGMAVAVAGLLCHVRLQQWAAKERSLIVNAKNVLRSERPSAAYQSGAVR